MASVDWRIDQISLLSIPIYVWVILNVGFTVNVLCQYFHNGDCVRQNNSVFFTRVSSICTSVGIYVALWLLCQPCVCLIVCFSERLFFYPFASPCLCLSAWMYAYSSICQSLCINSLMCISFLLSMRTSSRVSVFVCVCMSGCLSVCPCLCASEVCFSSFAASAARDTQCASADDYDK